MQPILAAVWLTFPPGSSLASRPSLRGLTLVGMPLAPHCVAMSSFKLTTGVLPHANNRNLSRSRLNRPLNPPLKAAPPSGYEPEGEDNLQTTSKTPGPELPGLPTRYLRTFSPHSSSVYKVPHIPQWDLHKHVRTLLLSCSHMEHMMTLTAAPIRQPYPCLDKDAGA